LTDVLDQVPCLGDFEYSSQATNPVIVLVDDAGAGPRGTNPSIGAIGSVATVPSAAQRALAGIAHFHGSEVLSPSRSVAGFWGIGGPIESSSRPLDPTKRSVAREGTPTAYPYLWVGEKHHPSPAAQAERSSQAVEIPSWFPPVLDRIGELSALSPNWDDHGALAIEAEQLAKALVFIAGVMAPDTPPPALVPIGNGGVQVEWHRAGLDVEVPFSKDDQPDLYCYDMESGEEWEGPAKTGFYELDLAMRLSGEARYAA
jgi:hypothetical protein